MELKEFINNTLTQIAEGVQSAIGQSDGKDYFVNPTMGRRGNSPWITLAPLTKYLSTMFRIS